MANSFLTELKKNIGQSATTVLTCGANTQTTIIGMTIANTTLTSPVYASVLFDGSGRTSGAEPEVYMVKDAPVPSGGSLVIVGGDQKVVMEPGDVIKVVSDQDSSLDVILSHLDIT